MANTPKTGLPKGVKYDEGSNTYTLPTGAKVTSDKFQQSKYGTRTGIGTRHDFLTTVLTPGTVASMAVGGGLAGSIPGAVSGVLGGLYGGALAGNATAPEKATKPKKVKATNESDTYKKTEEEQQYRTDIKSLLSPYATAMGQMPDYLQSLMGGLEQTPDYSQSDADAAAKALAEQYGGTITASTAAGTPTLNSDIASITAHMASLMSPTGPESKALAQFKPAMSQYEQAVPTEKLTTAILNRIKNTIMYEGAGGIFGSLHETQWPKYLKTIYNEVSGGNSSLRGVLSTKELSALASKNKKTGGTAGTSVAGSGSV